MVALLAGAVARLDRWFFERAAPLWVSVGQDAPGAGFVEYLTAQAQVARPGYKRMRVQARQVFVLADSSKAGKLSFARAGGWDKVHAVITDQQLDPKFAKEIVKTGIKLVRA